VCWAQLRCHARLLLLWLEKIIIIRVIACLGTGATASQMPSGRPGMSQRSTVFHGIAQVRRCRLSLEIYLCLFTWHKHKFEQQELLIVAHAFYSITSQIFLTWNFSQFRRAFWQPRAWTFWPISRIKWLINYVLQQLDTNDCNRYILSDTSL